MIEGNVDYFIKWVYDYQQAMGLINYDISIVGEYMDERGAIEVDEQGRLATISYSIDWISKSSTTLSEINRTAFHEIAELSLNKIRVMLEQHYAFNRVKELIHDIIVRLENTLWKEWVKPFLDSPEPPSMTTDEVLKDQMADDFDVRMKRVVEEAEERGKH